MADEPVYVLAKLTPKPEKAEEVLSGLQELAKLTEEGEPGTQIYQVFSQPDGTVIVFEKYKDAAAAKAHRDSPHFADAMKQGAETLAAPPEINIIKRVGGFSR